MHKFAAATLIILPLVLPQLCASSAPMPQPEQKGEELAISAAEAGQYGGMLVIGERTEPKTLNPILATDLASRDVIGRLTADLVHINRSTQKTESALASSWKVSRDGRTFTVKLRRGIRFSDGEPFNADDVVFSYQVYLDEKLHSPQRDLLIVGGKPLAVRKVDDYTVVFELSQPYAVTDRIFDSLAILPRRLLAGAYAEGKFAQAWNLSTAPEKIAGLGPFRLKQVVPGQRIVLERNPYYWKADSKGHRLPYLDEITFVSVGTEDAQIVRFQSGETNVISRFSADNYSVLEREQASRGYELVDLGPSLEYNFLFFNLNELPAGKLPQIASEQVWFRDVRFRQAVSLAVDRKSIVRLAYAGHATPLWGSVTPANKLWMDEKLPHPDRSVPRAKELLASAGFSWSKDGKLVDRQNRVVEFSIIVGSSNSQRVKMATLVADDLSQLGITAHVVPLELHAVVDRVFQTNEYEACILALGGGDADPNGDMNVWMSNGATHIWDLHETKPATGWEAEIDRLMNQQLVTLDPKLRKRLYDRVQELISDNVPLVFLATPDVLAGATKSLANFHPAPIDPYALWNVEELYFRQQGVEKAQR